MCCDARGLEALLKMEFSKLQLTSFLSVALATIFLIVGVSTNYWIQTVDSEKVVQSSIGLWKSCTYNAKGEATCVSWSSIKNSGELLCYALFIFYMIVQ